MINRAQPILFSTALIAAGWLVSAPARADLQACGGIFLSADAGCEYRPKKECMTECMTVAVEQSCVAQVYNECETSCTTTATTECENTCTATCVDNCTTTVTEEEGPSCIDLCLADCDSGGGEGYCGSSKHRNACGRCAKHTCERRCEEKCGDAEAPKKITTMTECMPTCTNACTASCSAKVNTQCQVDCQERTYTECEEKMVETCETQCEDKGGAIFCDGQFLNATNVNSCADELSLKLDIDVDIDATVKTVGNTTKKAADDVGDEIDDACSVTNVGAGAGTGGLSVLGSLIGLVAWRVRRRKSRR